MAEIKTVAIVGTGVIGAGWAARCMARGINVVATDPAPGAEEKLRAAITTAWPATVKLSMAPGQEPGQLNFTPSLEEAIAKADFVQESAPEREELKRKLYAQMDEIAPPHVILASSTSGYTPSTLQADCPRHPERVLVGHPFNPVYLLPLVEVVPGSKTSAQNVDTAIAFYERIGMHPLKVRNEIDGHLSDRLQEAIWREILHLVNDGVATTGELDEAIIYGPGLRWALMGTNLTFHLAGGEQGMRHMLEQFGPALKLPWTKLEAPELTETLIDRMVEGTQDQAAGRSIEELQQLRNDCLVDIMRVLRQHKVGAGLTLARDEAQNYAARDYEAWTPGKEIGAPLRLYQCAVQPQWVDYNGHMSESFYLYAFGDASDALFRFIGVNEDYRAAGKSFYTVETHLNFIKEVASGEPLTFATRILGLDEKRVHLFHEMFHAGTGKLLGTTEQMLLHVDMTAQKACPIEPQVFNALSAIWAVHQTMERPDQVGRVMQVAAS
jgi:carnitine 3-dehydrogenase